MKSLITILLLSACGLVYQNLSRVVQTQVPSIATSLDIAESKIEITRLDPVNQYADIARYPLFDATRRPPVVKIKTVKKKKKVPPKLQVQALGIAVTDDSVLAVVKNLRTGKIKRMKFDEQIDGWTLKEVGEDRFLFEKNGVQREILFKHQGG